MNARDVMSPTPVRAGAQTRLDDAIALMESESIRHLPVVSGERVVGIVSDRDLLEATGWLPSRVHACRGPEASDRVPRLVEEIMNRDVVQVSPFADITDLAAHMVDLRVGCVPVVEVDRLVGIVTETDIVRSFRFDDELRAKDVMTTKPLTISWFSTLMDAADICFTNGVRHLPVIEAGRPVGMLSDRDFRRALGEGRRDDTPIESVMTHGIVTVKPDETVIRIRDTLISKKISSICVVEEEEEVIGIVTLSDLLALCARYSSNGDLRKAHG